MERGQVKKRLTSRGSVKGVRTDRFVRKILIYRLGSLGDTCVALPALRVVRERYPEATITLLTNLPMNVKAAPAVAVLEGTGLVDDYLAYPVGTRNPLLLLGLAWKLRRQRFDVIVNLAAWRGERALRRDRFFFSAAGSGTLVGFQGGEGGKVRPVENGMVEFEAAALLRRVAGLGAADLADPRWWSMELSGAELVAARACLVGAGIRGNFVVLSVGAKVPAKDWTQPNWMDLAGRLGRRYPELGCVFIGSADEAERADQCLRNWPGPRLDLCGRTTPRESAAILALARLFVGHDSGPMHLAACVGTPGVAIFAARNPPRQWFPLGSNHVVLYHQMDCYGCNLSDCIVQAKKCILSITVDEVMDAIGRQLEGGHGT